MPRFGRTNRRVVSLSLATNLVPTAASDTSQRSPCSGQTHTAEPQTNWLLWLLIIKTVICQCSCSRNQNSQTSLRSRERLWEARQCWCECAAPFQHLPTTIPTILFLLRLRLVGWNARDLVICSSSLLMCTIRPDHTVLPFSERIDIRELAHVMTTSSGHSARNGKAHRDHRHQIGPSPVAATAARTLLPPAGSRDTPGPAGGVQRLQND
ncbi:uncharacterized protein LOC118511938 [Anopheles stephensi]|uniref:uncharacterized protein LOC118511938 n=1 Tax=Anopheles stephensi TaxID=30069 RepID=UPI00165896D3|nr:uncharacterized protein LOC118511938 [Anopheles stephensi]